MAREKRSRIRRRGGCFVGCLTRLIALLGFAALIFVAAHLLGFVQTDEETGRPVLNLGGGAVALPSGGQGGGFANLPSWPYGIRSEGMTLKVLRGGEGQALLLCCDGYTALIGGGSSRFGAGLQMLLCGAFRLDAALAPASGQKDAAGLAFAVGIGHPAYLFYTDTQTRTGAWQNLLRAAKDADCLVPTPGMSFTLGRGTVTFLGPVRTGHPEEEDDSLSLRVDYGDTGVLIPGGITGAGEAELLASGANLKANVLITAGDGRGGATGERWIAAAAPEFALLTGDVSESVRGRLTQGGAKVFSLSEYGVMTVYSDGSDVQVIP